MNQTTGIVIIVITSAGLLASTSLFGLMAYLGVKAKRELDGAKTKLEESKSEVRKLLRNLADNI